MFKENKTMYHTNIVGKGQGVQMYRNINKNMEKIL